MNRLTNFRAAALSAVFAAACATASAPAFAGSQSVGPTTISVVAATGGADAASVGVTCIKVAAAVVAACAAGYIAIPNNNNTLLAAALAAKLSGGTVSVLYSDAFGNNHCPGIAFTPCSVISIRAQ